MTGGYSKSFSLDELFTRLGSIENVQGVEFVGNWHITQENAPKIKEKLKEYQLSPVSVIPDHFGTPVWGKGAFTAPDAAVRKQAVKETMDMVDAARFIGCPLISIWNGQDGYDYPMQANYMDASQWMTEGITECANLAPDMKFSLEYKPKEPRNHSFIPNVWSAISYAADTKMPNVGVTVDVGHAFEAYENVSEAICMAARKNRLFHFHINDNYRLWDDDMIVGSIHTIEYIELFYWLKKIGYDGYISVDQYPYREDGREAADASIKWLRALEKAADRIDQNKMEVILAKNDAVASTNYMRELIFG
jgi:xylose isomerase